MRLEQEVIQETSRYVTHTLLDLAFILTQMMLLHLLQGRIRSTSPWCLCSCAHNQETRMQPDHHRLLRTPTSGTHSGIAITSFYSSAPFTLSPHGKHHCQHSCQQRNCLGSSDSLITCVYKALRTHRGGRQSLYGRHTREPSRCSFDMDNRSLGA